MFKKVFLLFLIVILFKSCISNPARVLAETNRVEYSLPYPGILPDSPFYILKVLRDNVTSFLIRDPKQNAFYQLFLSDKRLAAGQMLFAKGEKDLAITTITISQEYYTKAVDQAVKIKDQSLMEKLVVAGAKHEDVITDLHSDKLLPALSNDQKDKNRVLELLLLK